MSRTYDTSTVRRLILVLEEFRKIDPELPMQAALTFSIIVRNEGLRETTQKDIVAETGMTKASVSRLINSLVGKGVVAAERSTEDRRAWTLSLTPVGRRIAQSLVHLMDP